MPQITPNRVVTFLSPAFVALAGWATQWIAKNFPGHPHLSSSDLSTIFIAGGGFAAAQVAVWLHGWQKHEENTLAYGLSPLHLSEDEQVALAQAEGQAPQQINQIPPPVAPTPPTPPKVG